ncbi:hypothetical protein PITCH_A470009 [uncultured Desulfobacterium sp.]|uniref:Uncharacterized protein n=1 Tax=uncultured Desulfobacterium sp. TaxID=201089 RepID=A0A445N0A9_9BACT|nr:hypothetical protein PITCH_A470009 [uncultured Desulfobacterium sp.]
MPAMMTVSTKDGMLSEIMAGHYSVRARVGVNRFLKKQKHNDKLIGYMYICL